MTARMGGRKPGCFTVCQPFTGSMEQSNINPDMIRPNRIEFTVEVFQGAFLPRRSRIVPLAG
jgi:hypothetical protein